MTTPTISRSILTDRNSTYKARDVIEIYYIPPDDVPLLNGGTGETYLKAIVQLSGNCCVQPDEGGSSTIHRPSNDEYLLHLRRTYLFTSTDPSTYYCDMDG
jgi:hypothetical protein